MTKYGYIRVSTREQNEDRQRLAMDQLDIPPRNIFADKQSGRTLTAPSTSAWCGSSGGTICSISTASTVWGATTGRFWTSGGCSPRRRGWISWCWTMPLLDTRRGKDLMGTFLSDIVLQVLSFVAENERANLRQRQAEGIAAAKARGVRFGRPPRPLPENFHSLHRAWRAKTMTLRQAAGACGLPVATFCSKARKLEQR